jgi:hypothetical protein
LFSVITESFLYFLASIASFVEELYLDWSCNISRLVAESFDCFADITCFVADVNLYSGCAIVSVVAESFISYLADIACIVV